MLRFGIIVNKCLQGKALETFSVRLCSSKSSKKPNPEEIERKKRSSNEKDRRQGVKEKKINLLDQSNARTPLPGNVGPVEDHRAVPSFSKPYHYRRELRRQTRREANVDMLLKQLEVSLGTQDSKDRDICRESNMDLTVQKCPTLLGRDFQSLLGYQISGRRATLITFHRRSLQQSKEVNNSVSDGSIENDQEPASQTQVEGCKREVGSTDGFLQYARILQRKLNKAGFWADYIDNSSDWYKFNKKTNPLVNHLVLKLGVQYRNCELNVSESGSCKVVSHEGSNYHSYAGSLLTNASHDSPKLLKILNLLR